MRRLIVSSLLLALAVPAAAGPIYRWVDAQGTTHFGAQPPEGIDAQKVNPNVTRPSSTPTPLASKPAEAASAAQKQVDEKVKAEIAEQEAKREEQCLQMRTNLAQLQNNPRVRVEENGEMRRLGEDERQARITELQDSIREHCE